MNKINKDDIYNNNKKSSSSNDNNNIINNNNIIYNNNIINNIINNNKRVQEAEKRKGRVRTKALSRTVVFIAVTAIGVTEIISACAENVLTDFDTKIKNGGPILSPSIRVLINF
jgi:hypothetical protein